MMKWLSLSILLSISSLANSTIKRPRASFDGNLTTRIVGGATAGVNEFPFYASLWSCDGESCFFLCGASLIDRNWVLTAAHCLEDTETGRPTGINIVCVKDYNLQSETDGEICTGVDGQIIHPNFNRANFDNDIGLIQLLFSVDDVTPVRFADDAKLERQPGESLTVVGLGATQEGGDVAANLQELTLPKLNNAGCSNYGSDFKSGIHICMGDTGRDSCQGDSGGPLFYRENGKVVQTGVVSWGFGCARDGFPGIYARVSSYAGFIESVTGVSPITEESKIDPIIIYASAGCGALLVIGAAVALLKKKAASSKQANHLSAVATPTGVVDAKTSY